MKKSIPISKMIVAVSKRVLGPVILGIVLLLVLSSFRSARALDVIIGGMFRPVSQTKGPESKSSLEGASLQTVPEQELFKLRRADEFAKEGDFRSAIALWQSVLDTAGSQLITREDWNSVTSRHTYTKYVTVANQIESTLAGLTAEGLRAYRLRADAEARALLANPGSRTRTEVLSEVVRRFFLSSEGDEAAYELACLNLDRYEFTGASRLLKKCLDEHPDCSVPKKELLLRLALANGRIGDSEAAEKALSQLPAPKLETSPDEFSLSDARRMQLVKTDLSARRYTPTLVRDDWLTKFGRPNRQGAMPLLAKDMLVEPLTETWSQQFDVSSVPTTNNQQQQQMMIYGGGFSGFISGDITLAVDGDNANNPSGGKDKSGSFIDRKHMISQWSAKQWRPVNGLLFHDGFVYFKRANRVMCCNADSGEMEWMGLENAYEPPADTSRMFAMMGQAVQPGNKPTKPSEVQLFADHVYQAMSISDGNCYSVEGKTWMDKKQKAPQQQAAHIVMAGMTAPTRSRVNWLTAYHATNGKLKWRRPAGEVSEKAEDSKFDVGFTAAPVAGAGMIYTTINDSGSVWLLAMEPDSGETIWKTFLGDEPAGNCSPWSATGISYDGGDVYIGTGAGLIAAVEAVGGMLRWVVRYERSGKQSPVQNPFGGQMQFGSVSGWREDVVVPTGRALAVMGSDSDEIFALDRRTGEVLWDSPREFVEKHPADYYLGSLDGRLYVGGKSGVRCYDSVGGRAVWEARVEKSLGHGFVTSEAVYVPSDKEIVKLALEDGRELARTKLVTTTQEPVGNIYSHNQRLYAVGMARVYSMMRLRDRLDDLDARVKQRDLEAIMERAKFRAFQKKWADAWSDLNLGYVVGKTPAEEGASAMQRSVISSAKNVFTLWRELNVARATPGRALSELKLIADDLDSVQGKQEKELQRVTIELREFVEAALIRVAAISDESLGENLDQGEPIIPLKQLLELQSLCGTDHLGDRLVRAAKANCRSRDGELLNKLIDSADGLSQRLAIACVSKLGGSEIDTDKLKGLLLNDDPVLRFDVAIALLNAEDRAGLDELVKLLRSEDRNCAALARFALNDVTGENFSGSKSYKAASYLNAWNSWLAANRDSSKLKLPYQPVGLLLGRTLVCYVQSGRIVEYDDEGKQTWSVKQSMPTSVQGLRNGHRIVASMTRKRVYEFNAEGKQIWEQRVSGAISRAFRIANGNTLVALQSPGQVIEYRKDGSIAWKYTTTGPALDARRMSNGNTLIALQNSGKLIEVDPAKKVVWSHSGLGMPSSAQPLDNGNVLVTLQGGNRIIELSRDKKVVWQQQNLSGVMDAQRLPDGNVLVATQNGVREIDRNGKTVNASRLPKAVKNSPSRGRARSRGYGGGYGADTQNMTNRVYRY